MSDTVSIDYANMQKFVKASPMKAQPSRKLSTI